MTTRHQSRLAAAYRRNPTIANRDALIGDALYRRNQARITPTAALARRIGVYPTARLARRLGVDFVDFYVSLFGVMPGRI